MKNLFLLLIILFNLLLASPALAIKIGLQEGVDKAYIGSSKPTQVLNPHTNKLIYTMAGMQGYEFRPYRNSIAIKVQDDYFNLSSDYVVLKSESGGYLSAKQKWYRGYFTIYNKNGKLIIINNIDIEDYIKGVVPSEMPSKWDMEAHKAQAIAARSYALANLGKRANSFYDLKDTPEDQAYGGATSESAQTNQAVAETKGIVLIYDLKIIPAYYSASAGGQTSNSGEIWNKDLPYLRSVPSYDEGVKKNGHGIGMSQHGANNLAKKGYNAYQILQYFYKDIKFARINQDFYKY